MQHKGCRAVHGGISRLLGKVGARVCTAALSVSSLRVGLLMGFGVALLVLGKIFLRADIPLIPSSAQQLRAHAGQCE